MPDVVHIEATGLGGRDIGFPERWDISIRTDPEGQNVYGPSLATVEDVVVEPNGTGGQWTKHVTALGLPKATHEFLTLHYFALDSAEWWEHILGELLPNARFPGAVVRRTVAVQIFAGVHIAPSHRRYPHPVWVDSFSLIADLSGSLLGCNARACLSARSGGPALLACRLFGPVFPAYPLANPWCDYQRLLGGDCLPTCYAGHEPGKG